MVYRYQDIDRQSSLRKQIQKAILDALMKEPEKPLPTDCCGSGCERCVYDIYVEQLKQYKSWKKSQQQNQQTKTSDGFKNKT